MNLATAVEFQSEIARLQSYIELLEACGNSSHSALLVLDSAVKGMSAEIDRLRLTDEEREAVEYAAVVGRVASDLDREVLRGLLERTSRT